MSSQPLLLVDVGNTRTKWAIADQKTPLRVMDEMATTDISPESVLALRKKFTGHFLIVSSVVPKATDYFSRAFKRAHHVVSGESPELGLFFDYPHPKELGADRLAVAVAIHAETKFPAIIIACGTATAFTVLDAKGRLCGGAIAPGLQAQLDSLLRVTAQLPATKLRLPKSALAKSTGEAIRAGVVLNFQGGVKKIIDELTDALPGRVKPQIILTGGNAPFLTESLEISLTLRPLLVFEGLRIIGERLLKSGRHDS